MSYAVDLATHGAQLKRLYESVISSDPETTWAVFTYKGKGHQTLVPMSSGSGSLESFVEEFDDNRVQYGLVRIEYETTNKIVLVGWVGESVPDNVKGYFNAHFSAIAKYFDGYHVQITARCSNDLSPAILMRQVEVAAGSKYGSGAKKAPSTKPKYVSARDGADEDDWGDAAPVEERDHPHLNKVSGAYMPTKVDMAALRGSKSSSGTRAGDSAKGLEGLDGGSSYKPVGKIDIKAIREAGRDSKFSDTRVERIESSYKPVGKVDIKAIREAAKKQEAFQKKPGDRGGSIDRSEPAQPARKANVTRYSEADLDDENEGNRDDDNDDGEPKFGSLAERMRALNQDMQAAKPQTKPKAPVSAKPSYQKKAHASGTLPLRPGEKETKSFAATGYKDYGSSGGKTPAQLWAEKHGKFKAGGVPSAESDERAPEPAPAAPASPAAASSGPKRDSGSTKRYNYDDDEDDEAARGGVSDEDVDMAAARERFARASINSEPSRPAPPTRPGAGKTADAEEEKASFRDLTSRYARPQDPSPEPAAPPSLPGRPGGAPAPAAAAAAAPPSLPSRRQPEPEPQPEPEQGEEEGDGIVAIVEENYDEDPSEENEISLRVGETISRIEKLDKDWWLGMNSDGKVGLFPADFVRVISEGGDAATPAGSAAAGEPSGGDDGAMAGAVAIAEFDYEAADDDELGFRENDRIVNIEMTSEEWWYGELNGQGGVFPANRVRLL